MIQERARGRTFTQEEEISMKRNRMLGLAFSTLGLRLSSVAIAVAMLIVLCGEVFGCSQCSGTQTTTSTSTAPTVYCPGDLITVTTTVTTQCSVGTYPNCYWQSCGTSQSSQTTTASSASPGNSCPPPPPPPPPPGPPPPPPPCPPGTCCPGGGGGGGGGGFGPWGGGFGPMISGGF